MSNHIGAQGTFNPNPKPLILTRTPLILTLTLTLLYQARLPRLRLYHRPARRPSECWRERVRVNPLPLTLNP